MNGPDKGGKLRQGQGKQGRGETPPWPQGKGGLLSKGQDTGEVEHLEIEGNGGSNGDSFYWQRRVAWNQAPEIKKEGKWEEENRYERKGKGQQKSKNRGGYLLNSLWKRNSVKNMSRMGVKVEKGGTSEGEVTTGLRQQRTGDNEGTPKKPAMKLGGGGRNSNRTARTLRQCAAISFQAGGGRGGGEALYGHDCRAPRWKGMGGKKKK